MSDGKPAMVEQLIPLHIQAESMVASKITPLTSQYCSVCETPCCDTAYCSETQRSDFLQQVLRFQTGMIATDHNWLSATGCTLKAGKPMVCQQYFCDTIRNDQPEAVAEVEGLLKAWNAIYKNFHQGRSLLSSPASSFDKPRVKVLIERLKGFIAQHKPRDG